MNNKEQTKELFNKAITCFLMFTSVISTGISIELGSRYNKSNEINKLEKETLINSYSAEIENLQNLLNDSKLDKTELLKEIKSMLINLTVRCQELSFQQPQTDETQKTINELLTLIESLQVFYLNSISIDIENQVQNIQNGTYKISAKGYDSERSYDIVSYYKGKESIYIDNSKNSPAKIFYSDGENITAFDEAINTTYINESKTKSNIDMPNLNHFNISINDIFSEILETQEIANISNSEDLIQVSFTESDSPYAVNYINIILSKNSITFETIRNNINSHEIISFEKINTLTFEGEKETIITFIQQISSKETHELG